MRRNAFVFVPMILGLSSVAFGAEKPDLRGLVEAALRNDPNRLQASELLHAAEADAAYERTRRILSGNLSANIGKNGEIDSGIESGTAYGGEVSAKALAPAGSTFNLGGKYGYTELDSAETDSAEFSAGWTVPVFVNRRLIDPRLDKAAVASAIELPLESARESAAAVARETADGIIRMALDAASAERENGLAERRLALADREVVIAQVKRSYGALSFTELGEVEKKADEARLAALQAKFRFDSALRSLCSATGLKPDGMDLSRLAAPDSRDALTKVGDLSNNPSVLAAARERRSADYRRTLTGAEYAPSFGLNGTYSVPGPVSRNEGADKKDTWTASAVLSVPLPTGAASSNLKAADARLSAAYQGEAAARLKAEKEFAAARDAYSAALAKERLRESLLEQSRARLREVLSALESRTATELEADWARLTVDESDSALLDDASARLKAALDIYALGGLDPLDLISDSSRQKERTK